mmetsp:Transcript_32688/g.72213  ORF Transcript_32688/g.72213 Transcript_32688/m.72213 type:complete len:174 (+) Transcript_32688:21-542(+)|eukprot:CAMPEP_0202903484 /NCGR_PEP_ID=MMETSP1392-20130828/24661_1 /ASSEMBLY_ACC=CAM_ASM_000868 /TAXON_ID=225041 /ORGANISM="Chlamydomonas chlamydogama, Strain SAG 11-48b" /LENGTH=173 /DNA_ID=CAMNT_0049590687 /DNA_START=206 /DNA_END=727 /DNA_ORIENTATION=+
MDREVPRNHLDMRHRLDGQGKRYGKVIDYKVSELRAVELLDSLCGSMKSYSLVTTNDTASGKLVRHWAKFEGEGAMDLTNSTRPAKHEEEVRQRQLESFCGAVLEEHEDDLSEAIQAGKFEDTGVIEAFLCRQTTRICPLHPPEPQPEGAAESAADAGAAAASAAQASIKQEL